MASPELTLVEKENSKSAVWQYFAYEADAEVKAKDLQKLICKRCFRMVPTEGENTTNLSKHLKDRHPDLFKALRERSARHSCFFCCFRYCQDCPHNGEIWILVFLLSCLSASMSIAEAERQDFRELGIFLKKHEQDFKNSDATYYTPIYETGEACVDKILICYILEVQVILYETKGERSINQLEPMARHFQSQDGGNESCSPCEAFEETNSVTFIESFRTFLHKIENEAHSVKDD